MCWPHPGPRQGQGDQLFSALSCPALVSAETPPALSLLLPLCYPLCWLTSARLF